MVFWITHNGDTATAGNHHIAFGHILLGIVSAFGMNVRAQQADKLGDIRSIKDRNGINVTERRQNFGAFITRYPRPTFALEGPRTCI